MRFLTLSTVVFCIALGAMACGGDPAPLADPRAQNDLVQPRALAELWTEVLAQRDLVHGFVSVEEIWHEENAGTAAAAEAMESALSELGVSLDRLAKIDSERRAGIDLEIGRVYQTLAAIRDLTKAGVVGDLPRIMSALDLALLGLEQRFYPEELGSNSITSHPGFNPILPRPPDSPL